MLGSSQFSSLAKTPVRRLGLAMSHRFLTAPSSAEPKGRQRGGVPKYQYVLLTTLPLVSNLPWGGEAERQCHQHRPRGKDERNFRFRKA